MFEMTIVSQISCVWLFGVVCFRLFLQCCVRGEIWSSGDFTDALLPQLLPLRHELHLDLHCKMWPLNFPSVSPHERHEGLCVCVFRCRPWSSVWRWLLRDMNWPEPVTLRPARRESGWSRTAGQRSSRSRLVARSVFVCLMCVCAGCVGFERCSPMRRESFSCPPPSPSPWRQRCRLQARGYRWPTASSTNQTVSVKPWR